MPVALEYPKEGLLELLVGERVAERVDGAVEVAEPVGDVIEQRQAAAVGQRAEPDDQRQDVPRCPAEDERSEDDGDGPQRLAGTVLRLAAGRRRRSALRLVLLATPRAVSRRPVAAGSPRFRRASAGSAPTRRPDAGSLATSAAASLLLSANFDVFVDARKLLGLDDRFVPKLSARVRRVCTTWVRRCRHNQIHAVVFRLSRLLAVIGHRRIPKVDTAVDGLPSTAGTGRHRRRQPRLPDGRRRGRREANYYRLVVVVGRIGSTPNPARVGRMPASGSSHGWFERARRRIPWLGDDAIRFLLRNRSRRISDG